MSKQSQTRGELERYEATDGPFRARVSQSYTVTVDSDLSTTTEFSDRVRVHLSWHQGDSVTFPGLGAGQLMILMEAVENALEILGVPSRSTADSDVIDQIALGLGTKHEWDSGELEWIAGAIGRVRPHPGHDDPAEYVGDFWGACGTDPENDSRMRSYLSDDYRHERWGEGS